ncbi:helix-turn-helix domain-containing protein [Brevibacillus sp. GCM10020057]|uniref:helix-turn-helix domain-containing protein n=1 Tax=Brevibacillus sp. GCM10020057 TaxID=3317327 RepID=UPI0036427F19
MRKKITWDDKKAALDLRFSREELELMEYKAHIAKIVVENRLRRNWSQAELAQKAGLHQSQIARIENGEQLPNSQTLGKIAKAFEMSVGFIPKDEEAAGEAVFA